MSESSFVNFTLLFMRKLQEKEIIVMNERNDQIAKFMEAWDAMLAAANNIEGFTWKISVSITSDQKLVADRVKTINGINESFAKHNMRWTSSNT